MKLRLKKLKRAKKYGYPGRVTKRNRVIFICYCQIKYESRSKHAKKRKRGIDGKFLSKENENCDDISNKNTEVNLDDNRNNGISFRSRSRSRSRDSIDINIKIMPHELKKTNFHNRNDDREEEMELNRHSSVILKNDENLNFNHTNDYSFFNEFFEPKPQNLKTEAKKAQSVSNLSFDEDEKIGEKIL